MLHSTLVNSSTQYSLALLTGFGCWVPTPVDGDLRPVGDDVPCDPATTDNCTVIQPFFQQQRAKNAIQYYYFQEQTIGKISPNAT